MFRVELWVSGNQNLKHTIARCHDRVFKTVSATSSSLHDRERLRFERRSHSERLKESKGSWDYGRPQDWRWDRAMRINLHSQLRDWNKVNEKPCFIQFTDARSCHPWIERWELQLDISSNENRVNRFSNEIRVQRSTDDWWDWKNIKDFERLKLESWESDTWWRSEGESEMRIVVSRFTIRILMDYMFQPLRFMISQTRKTWGLKTFGT